MYLLTLSYNTLNNPSNSRAPESAKICLISDNLAFLIYASTTKPPNCVFFNEP